MSKADVCQECERQAQRMNAANALMEYARDKRDSFLLATAEREFAEASYLVMSYHFLVEEHRDAEERQSAALRGRMLLRERG